MGANPQVGNSKYICYPDRPMPTSMITLFFTPHVLVTKLLTVLFYNFVLVGGM